MYIYLPTDELHATRRCSWSISYFVVLLHRQYHIFRANHGSRDVPNRKVKRVCVGWIRGPLAGGDEARNVIDSTSGEQSSALTADMGRCSGKSRSKKSIKKTGIVHISNHILHIFHPYIFWTFSSIFSVALIIIINDLHITILNMSCTFRKTSGIFTNVLEIWNIVFKRSEFVKKLKFLHNHRKTGPTYEKSGNRAITQKVQQITPFFIQLT